MNFQPGDKVRFTEEFLDSLSANVRSFAQHIQPGRVATVDAGKSQVAVIFKSRPQEVYDCDNFRLEDEESIFREEL